jgi:hypothetical protein
MGQQILRGKAFFNTGNPKHLFKELRVAITITFMRSYVGQQNIKRQSYMGKQIVKGKAI